MKIKESSKDYSAKDGTLIISYTYQRPVLTGNTDAIKKINKFYKKLEKAYYKIEKEYYTEAYDLYKEMEDPIMLMEMEFRRRLHITKMESSASSSRDIVIRAELMGFPIESLIRLI